MISVQASFTIIVTLSFLLSCRAFTASSSSQRLDTTLSVARTGYVPFGLTSEEYSKIRKQEASKMKGKDLARLGPRGFKSRSMQAWQEAYERGETTHTFASVGYKEKLKLGLLKWEDVPYMIRGGSWDNSDVKGATKLVKWTKTDKEYARGGFKREQSKSILGSGPGFDWTGTGTSNADSKRSYPGLF